MIYSKLLSKISYVVKCPGHRNSKGDLAEWCVRSHDTGEIISSHHTKSEAEEHLRQMHIHKGHIANESARVPKKLIDALTNMDYDNVSKSKSTYGDGIATNKIVNYLKNNGIELKKIGEGSSRVVYKINENLVLKLAMNNKGIAQNKQEYEIYTKVKTCSLIARIFYYGANYSWLISEAATRVRNEDFRLYFKPGKSNIYNKDLDSTIRNLVYNSDICTSDFKKDINYLCSKSGLSRYDIDIPEQWGTVTRNGQRYPVLIDYGLTDDVWDKHYSASTT